MNAIQMPYVGLGAFPLGDVLQCAEPAHSAFRVDVPLNRLDRLANLDPCVVGATEAIFDVDTRPRCTRFKRLGTKACAVRWMKNVQPLARASRHVGSIDSDELRQRLRPTFERSIRSCNDMRELGHPLRMTQSRFTLLQRLCQLRWRRLYLKSPRYVGRTYKARSSPFIDDFVRNTF